MRINPEQKPRVELGVTESARRSQIIDATIAVIAELGFHQASYARIVARAGLSSSRIISYHLGSKADLIQAVLLSIIDSKDRFLWQRSGNPTNRHDIIRGYIESEVAFLGKYPEKVRALREIEDHISREDPMPGLLVREVRVGRLIRQLQQGQREGSFGQFDVEIMAESIAYAIDGANGAFHTNPQLDLEHYGRELANLFQRALEPKHPNPQP
jgi:AcrR family transcriptional regulator